MPPSERPPRQVEAGAVTAPIRRRRVPSGLSRVRLVLGGTIMVALALIPLAIIVFTFVYAVSGPSLPFLVNRNGPEKGPAPMGERIQAVALCIPGCVAALWAVRQGVRYRVRRPGVTLDGRGVWLVRGGRHVQQGLVWSRIAAVNIVAAGGDTSVPAEAATPPFVEIFTVDPIKESRSPLAARVVNAPPARRGLRGKRYVLELTGPPEAGAELAAAVERFAPGTLLNR